MADVQSSSDIDATAKKLRDNDPPPLPADPDVGLGLKKDGVTSALADVQRRQIAADEAAFGMVGKATAEIPRLEEMAKHAGVEAEKLKPWNEEAESAKRESDPITNFASLGSVFGILASAFTHAPMQNAMEASAAAINAIKEGNKEGYNRAYKAWQDNTKQALERHQIEHDAFEDAMTLMKTNMEAGMMQMRINAVRFGDQKALVMIDAGMDKELLEAQAARQRLSEDITKNMVPMAEANSEMAILLNNGYNPKNPNDSKNIGAIKELNKYKADMDALKKVPSLSEEEGRTIRDYSTTPGPDGKLPTAEERKDFIKDLQNRRQQTPNQVALDRFMEEHADDNNGKGPTAEQIRDFNATLPAGKGSGRVPKPEEDFVNKRTKEYMDQGEKETDAKIHAQRDWKLKTVTPSGNRMDDIKGREAKITYMEDTIDKIDNALVKHKAITGIGGKVTRAGEAIGNILGSSAADRAQFRRWVLEMQEWGMSVLNDRNGRPISSEAEKIEGIFAGLAAGDTNANTLRGYDEIRPLLKKIKQQLRERRGAEPESPDEAPKPEVRPRWEDAPVVGAH